MGNLDGKGILSAVEIAFYAPALVLIQFVIFRQKFSRLLGWIYLAILCILRIIGSSCTIYSETNNDFSQSLLETAAITSAIGIAPLLVSTLGFLKSVNDNMQKGRGLPDVMFYGIQLVVVVGLVLSIIGFVDRFEDLNPYSNKATTGRKITEASSIIFLVIFIVLAGVCAITIHRIRAGAGSATERKFAYACIAALPFLLVRVIYIILVCFAETGSNDFYFLDVSVYAEAFMVFLAEAIVILFFITAGLLTPKGKPAHDRELGNAAGGK